MNHLLFQLYGTLQAWGSPLPGNIRQTEDHPTKSGIIGYIASCMGITYQMEDEFIKLSQSLQVACRVDKQGEKLYDFQIVKINGKSIVSHRYYLVEACFTICLTGKYKLSTILDAINRPIFSPFLGRKCCTQAIHPNPQIIKTTNLFNAFKKYPVSKFINDIDPNPIYYWEKDISLWECAEKHIQFIEKKNKFDEPIGIRKYQTRFENKGKEEKCIFQK